MPEIYQSTLKNSAMLSGPGLHTGRECSITLHPAEADNGIVFATEQGEIPASIEYVRGTNRGTSLYKDGAEVHTVEHVLAALAGLGVTNACVEIQGPEIPAGDGSALPFVELIDSIGIEEQEATVPETGLLSPVWVIAGDKYMLAAPAEGFSVRSLISFSHPMIGEQAICLRLDSDTFRREIAPARTFCTFDEVEMLQANGLGLGGSEDNVIVVYENRYSSPLRFADEFVRHKVLDLIGDMSLVRGRLNADITAIKPSHALNAALAERIARSTAGSM